jgi:protein-disulfide isomerase
LASRKDQREEARKQREEREAQERAAHRRKRRIWQVGSALALAAVLVVIAIAVSSSGGSAGKATPRQANQTSSLFQGIPQSGITLGNPKAKVTMYEFADLQCPFCKQYTEKVFPQIVTNYVKTGKVKMVWRNLTFIGPDSVTAARAAAAAGKQNKLWNFADLFYKNQGTENSGYVTDTFIQSLAPQVGLNTTQLTADESAPFVEQQLGEAQNQAQQFGVSSTPSFLLQVGNGKPQKLNYAGFTLGDFSGQLDKAIKQAGG